MTWLKIDDQQLLNPKYRAAGLFGRALRDTALQWCAGQENDGHIPSHMLMTLAALAEIPLEQAHATANKLVGIGLWDEAPKLENDTGDSPGWVNHDWLVYQPSRADLIARRARDRRKKELHSKNLEPLRLEVRGRDKDRCRYCAVPVVFAGSGSRGPFGGTFDHVDPDGPNSVANVVLACHGCNSSKKNRSPAAAGMTLLPAPGDAPAPPPAPVAKRAAAQRRAAGRTGAAGNSLRPGAGAPKARSVPPPPARPRPASPRSATPRPTGTRRPARKATGPPAVAG